MAQPHPLPAVSFLASEQISLSLFSQLQNKIMRSTLWILLGERQDIIYKSNIQEMEDGII